MRDLNSNALDDMGTGGAGDGCDATCLQTRGSLTDGGWIEIFTISDAQFTGDMSWGSLNAAGPGSTGCLNRPLVDVTEAADLGRRCYIVVRAEAVYRPFFLSPAFGRLMKVHAYAIKPVSADE